ncbi:hypothetical protein E3N88_00879 [Mikania micrantha]|uniref:Uncharacterized protein n=1 Tax=Mikania micrantha TaxID=192012 RepID=A0A5N6Q042_9ASTR|nr:hypothetical protein E3N88_00879 [Mikania micrantha]
MRGLVNIGENRARNGVPDCPESQNEENYKNIKIRDARRFRVPALPINSGALGNVRTFGWKLICSRVLKTWLRSSAKKNKSLLSVCHVMMNDGCSSTCYWVSMVAPVFVLGKYGCSRTRYGVSMRLLPYSLRGKYDVAPVLVTGGKYEVAPVLVTGTCYWVSMDL